MKPEDVPEGPLLLDTDVFSWITWRRERYAEFDALIKGHTLALSFATVGELRAGAIKADWSDKRQRLEDRISQHYVVLTSTDAVTAKWAEIYARLRDELKGGGVNDMWTAACALAQPVPLPVVTGNLSDFGRIAVSFLCSSSIRTARPDPPRRSRCSAKPGLKNARDCALGSRRSTRRRYPHASVSRKACLRSWAS